jgi:zinc protease
MNEIGKLKESGPLQVNLDKFKAEDLRSLELDLKSNSFWLGYLTRKQQEHGNMHQIFNYTKTLDKVTTQTVQARAKEYLSGKNYIRLVQLPENNK